MRPDEAEPATLVRRVLDFVPLAGVGAALFLVCCLLVPGGPLDAVPYGDVHLYATYAGNMASGHWPYGDFFDEYPPLAQPLFLFVHVLPGGYAHAFRWTMALMGAAAVVLMVAALASVGASRLRLAVAAVVAGIAPYVLLALAVAAKIYPVVLLPLALVETWERGGRELARRMLLWFGGVLVLVHLPFAVMGPGGLRYSYWIQLKRGLEVESLGGALLLVLDRLGLRHTTLVASFSTNVAGGLASAIATITSLVALAAIVLVVWLYLKRRRDPLVAASAAVVAFVAFGKVFSPQYVDWFVPLVPAAGAVASGLLIGVLALTHVVFDRFHAPGGPDGAQYKAALAWWVFVRDVLVVALYVWLVLRLRRKPATSSA